MLCFNRLKHGIFFDNINVSVEEKYIIEAAKKCKIEKECNNDTITLKELYDLKYLEKQVNPVTKEYYSEDAYVTLKNNEYVFIN